MMVADPFGVRDGCLVTDGAAPETTKNRRC